MKKTAIALTLAIVAGTAVAGGNNYRLYYDGTPVSGTMTHDLYKEQSSGVTGTSQTNGNQISGSGAVSGAAAENQADSSVHWYRHPGGVHMSSDNTDSGSTKGASLSGSFGNASAGAGFSAFQTSNSSVDATMRFRSFGW